MHGTLEKGISDTGSFLSEASTWIPEWLPNSAWMEHAPFAFWLVETHEPEILIELGTHGGYSFFSFCQAIARLKLSTRAYAVDTWKGDEHAGFYGEEVFREVSKHNTEQYSGFSQLIRSTFDDALPYFEDGSVDLLHIDGRHFYEDVKHDFNSWLPKLSDRGIVLLHDINVRERSFGVFRFWAELSQHYPHFQFFHGWGLGVLGVGKRLPRRLKAIFEIEGNSKRANKVRNIYARLGASLDDRSARRRSASEIGLKEAEASTLKAQICTLEAQIANSRGAGEAALSELSEVRSRLSASEARGTELEAALTLRAGELSGAITEFAEKERKAAQQRREVEVALCEAHQKLDSSKLQLAAVQAARAQQHEDAAQQRADLERRLVEAEHSATQQRADLEGKLSEARQQLQSLHAQFSGAKAERDSSEAAVGKLRRELGSTVAQLDAAKTQLDAGKAQLNESAAEQARQRDDAARQCAELETQRAASLERAASAEASCESLRAEHDGVLNSTFWRSTGPARRLAAVLPPVLRRQLRRGARVVYWILPPHRTAARLAQVRARNKAAPAAAAPSAGLQSEQNSEANAARANWKFSGWAELFNRNWYLERYPDVAAAKLDPLDHFIEHGAVEGRDPNSAFDTAWYFSTYPDVANAHVIAFVHFVEWGAAEGRRPLCDFDYDYYREQAGIPHASNLEAYRHYLECGQAAGLDERSPPTFTQLLRNRFGSLDPLRVYEAPHHGPRVTIVTDGIDAGRLYGGVATSIILGVLMARRLRADLRLVTRTEPADATSISMVLRTHGVSWGGNVECLYSPPGQGGRDIPIDRDDFFLTTSWWTTRATRSAVPANQIVYMLGEDERLFYPAGDDYLLCGETLSDPDIFYAVNSRVLFEHLQTNGLAPGGVAFEPAFSSTAYYPAKPRAENGRRQFFFYGRPNNLRNLYWRGVSAIAAAIDEEIFDPEKWDFTFLGKDINEMLLPRRVRPRIMNDASREDYLELVRRADIGLSLICTPHPSYPPFDLAASGAVVVTNRFGSKTDLSQYSPNILCVEPSLPGLVAGLRSAVALAKDREERIANIARFAMPRDWESALAPVIDCIADRCLKR
ncbi:MAG TPA: class I SAM-dependent methyltransferase [Xanthobacteraceae bacterium]